MSDGVDDRADSGRATKHCLDLFAGLGGWSQAFRGRPDWEVTTVDFSEVFHRKLHLDDWGFRTTAVESHVPQDVVADIRDLSFRDFEHDFTVVLGGPPCPGFSMMNVGRNWDNGTPDSDSARESIELLFKTFELVEALAPDYYAIENPTGMAGDYLHAFADRVDIVTQCQYGKRWQKPTYIAHNIPAFEPRKCENGAGCHESASRSADAGTQAQNIASADRAVLPRELSAAVRNAIEADLAGETAQATLGEVVA